jgi:hypothetical protein
MDDLPLQRQRERGGEKSGLFSEPIFDDDQCVTTLRDLFGRLRGEIPPKAPKDLKTHADFEAKRNQFAYDQAESAWESLHTWQREERSLRKTERALNRPVMPPMTEEITFVRQVTSRNRTLREGAAASLHGRNLSPQALSPQAARALVWQLRHRNPAYREAAMDALWGSTITDSSAARVLALQLEHRKPELREVARQVLQDTNIKTDGEVMEYLESARRRSLGDSEN